MSNILDEINSGYSVEELNSIYKRMIDYSTISTSIGDDSVDLEIGADEVTTKFPSVLIRTAAIVAFTAMSYNSPASNYYQQNALGTSIVNCEDFGYLNDRALYLKEINEVLSDCMQEEICEEDNLIIDYFNDSGINLLKTSNDLFMGTKPLDGVELKHLIDFMNSSSPSKPTFSNRM